MTVNALQNTRVVLSDSEPDLSDDSDESVDDASTTECCLSHPTSNTKAGTGDASDISSDDALDGASGESDDDPRNATSKVRDPSYRKEITLSNIDIPSQARGSKMAKRKADMAGIDAYNIITPSPRALNKSDPLQNDDEGQKQFQRYTRGYGRRIVSYDMKYHPMDDILRPKYSAKRRAKGEQVPEVFRDSDEESDEDDEDEASSKVTSPNTHRRRSSRNIHLRKRPNYSAKWHPLDQMLKENASLTKAVKDDDHSKTRRRPSESSSTLKDEEESISINATFDHGQGSTTASIPSSPRRSARVSSSKNGPPNYDMK